MDDQPVGAHLALRPHPLARAIGETGTAPAADRIGELEDGVRLHRCAGECWRREPERRLERLDLAAQRGGEDAVDLPQRSLRGGGLAVEPKPPGGEQPEGDHHCLVVAQHEGWEPVAGADPVAAADTALTLDRDAELLERRDVAPHGARADVEPLADLAPCDERLRLQELEQREQPGGRRRHVSESITDRGRK